MKRWILFLCMAVTLSACALPKEQAFVAASAQPMLAPEYLVTADGKKLPLRAWLPKAKPQAVVVAVHGFNDYSKAFELPSGYFTEHGIALYAYDQRGFGLSESHGIWAGEQNLSSDLAAMVAVARAKHPGVPLYILGDSMGGAVAITALAEKKVVGVDGAILVAPAVWGGDTMNVLYRMVLWVAAHTMPGKQVTGKGLNIIASNNIEMLIALGQDPYIIKSTRTDAVYGMVKLMDKAFASVDKVETPLLVLYGAHDMVVPRKPIKEMVKKLTAPHVFAYYADGYHMLLRDLDADIVLEDIVAWMRDPNAPLPSGYDKDWEVFIDKGGPPFTMLAQNKKPKRPRRS